MLFGCLHSRVPTVVTLTDRQDILLSTNLEPEASRKANCIAFFSIHLIGCVSVCGLALNTVLPLCSFCSAGGTKLEPNYISN